MQLRAFFVWILQKCSCAAHFLNFWFKFLLVGMFFGQSSRFIMPPPQASLRRMQNNDTSSSASGSFAVGFNYLPFIDKISNFLQKRIPILLQLMVSYPTDELHATTVCWLKNTHLLERRIVENDVRRFAHFSCH